MTGRGHFSKLSNHVPDLDPVLFVRAKKTHNLVEKIVAVIILTQMARNEGGLKLPAASSGERSNLKK